MADALSPDYAERLKRLNSRWKRLLKVQAPYRWNLRRLRPGFVLDIGCGLGRNLEHMDGHGVGVDANPVCVAAARTAGFEAYDPEGFHASVHARSATFDSLLVSHVLEHMNFDEAVALVGEYLGYLKPEGQVILITPQELGHRLDHTHVHYMDAGELRRLAERLGLSAVRSFSFPFPRFMGWVFPYNESVLAARRRGQGV
jgi:2-polyprenyl-3-methyl-5-hydroxy-6-metoxy-1,4-benzoquinol methylase